MQNKSYNLWIGRLIMCLAMAGCSVDEADVSSRKDYQFSDLSPEYYGNFAGVWTVEKTPVEKTSLRLTVRFFFSSFPLTQDMQQAVVQKIGTKEPLAVQADGYTVAYRETGYSVNSYYFDIMPRDYEYTVIANGKQHTVRVVMEQTGSVAMFDKKTASLTAIFYIRQIEVDGAVAASYRPALTLQFNSTNQVRTSGV